ncbi:MAG: GAF domain-containing protein [Candidatus Thermoplasmatota archaeon]
MNYEHALTQIQQMISNTDPKNLLQTIVDTLYHTFPTYNWVGIYLLKDNNLILEAWQGKQPTEHTTIPLGVGICGSAAQTGKTEVIDHVSQDHRYLACFTSTQSELVVPIKKTGTIIGEIDIDSDTPAAFKPKDVAFVEKIADMLAQHIR